MSQLIQFLLVPDGSAARRLRRILATQSPSMGIAVGTWPELIEQAKSAYVIAPQVSDWKSQFHAALEQLPDAFWSNSFEVAPQEVAAEVEAALSLVVSATQPINQWTSNLPHNIAWRTMKSGVILFRKL